MMLKVFIKMILAIGDHGPLCVTELIPHTRLNYLTILKSLKELVQLGLVKTTPIYHGRKVMRRIVELTERGELVYKAFKYEGREVASEVG